MVKVNTYDDAHDKHEYKEVSNDHGNDDIELEDEAKEET